jgi:putative transposase
MVVRPEPKTSSAKVMQVIKSISAREFFKLRPEIRKHYFWGGELWTQSSFVETIGNANEDVIRAYAQNQLKAMNENEVHGQQLGLF